MVWDSETGSIWLGFSHCFFSVVVDFCVVVVISLLVTVCLKATDLADFAVLADFGYVFSGRSSLNTAFIFKVQEYTFYIFKGPVFGGLLEAAVWLLLPDRPNFTSPPKTSLNTHVHNFSKPFKTIENECKFLSFWCFLYIGF